MEKFKGIPATLSIETGKFTISASSITTSYKLIFYLKIKHLLQKIFTLQNIMSVYYINRSLLRKQNFKRQQGHEITR